MLFLFFYIFIYGTIIIVFIIRGIIPCIIHGFAEISEEEFRKKFNEVRFQLFDDDKIDKNKLKKFAEENVTNSYVPINEATILNTIQKLKLEEIINDLKS